MAQRVHVRCTFCDSLITWSIPKKDLGLKPEEEFRIGQIYPYEKCTCGWGKFVTCEQIGGTTPAPEPVAAPDGDIREQIVHARYATIPLDQIDPNPFQPRKFFDGDWHHEKVVQLYTIHEINRG